MQNDHYGTLVINVKTARGALPVADALVTVKDSAGGIINVLHTGRSGLTARIKLETEPRVLSLDSENEKNPYREYIIETSKEGFYTVENTNVPIFEGITSVQPIELMPMPDGMEPSADNIIYYDSSEPDL